jgi:hypothetical protein
MKYPPNVVLKLPLSPNADLDTFVEDCVDSGVRLIAVWGEGASEIEDDIDWLIIGDGSQDRFIVTTSHPPDDDAIEFASIDGGEVTVVTL